MATDFEARLKKAEMHLRDPASILYATQQLNGNETAEKSTLIYGKLINAHLLLSGLIGKALKKVHGERVRMSRADRERESLFASFIIGMDLCERAISEGRYIQAMTLVRQEMETIAQFTHVRNGTRREKGSPNMAGLNPSVKRLYGGLSAAAHLSKHEVLLAATVDNLNQLDFLEPTISTRYFPSFNSETSKRLFTTHLILLMNLIEEMSKHYDEIFTEKEIFCEEDSEVFEMALSLMISEGMVIDDAPI